MRLPGMAWAILPSPPPRSRWLAHAAAHFSSIELNGTFYSLKTPDAFRRWYDATPDDFVLAVKGSRFITHNLKLRNAETALANFYATGVLTLGRKAAPSSWPTPRARFHMRRS